MSARESEFRSTWNRSLTILKSPGPKCCQLPRTRSGPQFWYWMDAQPWATNTTRTIANGRQHILIIFGPREVLLKCGGILQFSAAHSNRRFTRNRALAGKTACLGRPSSREWHERTRILCWIFTSLWSSCRHDLGVHPYVGAMEHGRIQRTSTSKPCLEFTIGPRAQYSTPACGSKTGIVLVLPSNFAQCPRLTRDPLFEFLAPVVATRLASRRMPTSDLRPRLPHAVATRLRLRAFHCPNFAQRPRLTCDPLFKFLAPVRYATRTRTDVRGYHMPSLRDYDDAQSTSNFAQGPRLTRNSSSSSADVSIATRLASRRPPRTYVRGYHMPSLRDDDDPHPLSNFRATPPADTRSTLQVPPPVVTRLASSYPPRTHVRGYHMPSLRDYDDAHSMSNFRATPTADA